MADKAVSELVAAEQITATDLFVLEQNGTAKKLTGQILLNWLTAAADGHGGISSIEKVNTSGLSDTYRITLADTTTFDLIVNNGRGISSIAKTSVSGLVDTYTISYNDGTSNTFTVTNGAKGDTGAAAYVWVKWASQEPTASSNSFGDVPDDWMGIYSGTSATAPTDWTQYQWYNIKGNKGETGDPAELVSYAVEYLASDSGTVIPSGSWTTTIPTVAQGKYLWTRVTQTYNTGDPIKSYSVSRMGVDGNGSVVSVNLVSPDADGNVALTAAIIGALATDGSGMMAGNLNMGSNRLVNLADPVDDNDAVNLAYMAARIGRNVSVTEQGAMAVGATFEVSESIIGKNPVFATLAYYPAMGRATGGTGNTQVKFYNITSLDGGLYLNYAVFNLTDDGLTLTLESTKRVKVIAGAATVEEGITFNFGEVKLVFA